MARFILRRLLLLPLVLLAANAAGFFYASLAGQALQSSSPFGGVSEAPAPVFEQYGQYLQGLTRGDLGEDPRGAKTSLEKILAGATLASAGLLGAAFLLSLVIGLPLGLAAVQVDPPRTRAWLTALTTLGLAVPGFYAGTLLISLVLAEASARGGEPLLPVGGFGWGLPLLLPVIALMLRPTVQIARVAGGLLADELGRRYVTAARGFGHTWQRIRSDKALRNILAPLLLSISNAFRVSVAELVLVEWLFNWPGLGKMLASALTPPKIGSVGGLFGATVFFLHPPTLAALLSLFAAAFYLFDTLASGLAHRVDPRLDLPLPDEEARLA